MPILGTIGLFLAPVSFRGLPVCPYMLGLRVRKGEVRTQYPQGTFGH